MNRKSCFTSAIKLKIIKNNTQLINIKGSPFAAYLVCM